ncbi:MAG: aspartyl protease family protein [Terriglobales bacterium]
MVQIQALIDTGASDLCIDPSIFSQLGLTPTGSCQVNTPTTGQQPAQSALYDVSFFVPAGPGQVPLAIQTMPAIATELLQLQGFHALIGRSILRNCLLTYDGQASLFSLAY